jgi:hypothetical protein
MMSRLVSHQKDATPVRFDRTGLDLSAYASPAAKSRRAVYDLYALSNHSGSIGGGHYTAVAKQLRGDQWCDAPPRWVTLRARWVMLRARWVTLRARWVMLRARWVTR